MAPTVETRRQVKGEMFRRFMVHSGLLLGEGSIISDGFRFDLMALHDTGDHECDPHSSEPDAARRGDSGLR